MTSFDEQQAMDLKATHDWLKFYLGANIHGSDFERSMDNALVELVKAVDSVIYHGKRRDSLVGPIIAIHTLAKACRGADNGT